MALETEGLLYCMKKPSKATDQYSEALEETLKVSFAQIRRWIFGPSRSLVSKRLTVWSISEFFTLSRVRPPKTFPNIQGCRANPSSLTSRLITMKESGLFRSMGELHTRGLGAEGMVMSPLRCMLENPVLRVEGMQNVYCVTPWHV